MQIEDIAIRFIANDSNTVLIESCGFHAIVQADARFEFCNMCVLAWTVVRDEHRNAPVACCTSFNLVTGEICQVFSSDVLPDLPVMILPRSDRATILFFGANPVEILPSGRVVRRGDQAFVGTDGVIYTRVGIPFDQSPFKQEVTWMQGAPGFFMSLLSQSGQSMFLTAAAP